MLGNPLQGNKPVNISSAACITKAVRVSPLECLIVTLMSSCKTIIHVNYVDWFYKAILELQLPVNNLKVDSCNKTQRKKSLDLRSVTCIPFTIIVRILWGQYLCCLRKYMYIYPYPSRSFFNLSPFLSLGKFQFQFLFLPAKTLGVWKPTPPLHPCSQPRPLAIYSNSPWDVYENYFSELRHPSLQLSKCC